ncbi:hypothetical protein CAPTEDRAFT_199633 [Capitella teleta]|uniref:Uncharacterized protein n=1 Tax=Capitella teleta TaxID=283909 RepID=R7U9J0_CAPTE|nr:hypothetical protein CAPTEDRAFT_199633 [Capitella teleta]|eukprot:ELU02659.1 hypothetical protein CAPTEDRAFT_199633 [Capitella teleta]
MKRVTNEERLNIFVERIIKEERTKSTEKKIERETRIADAIKVIEDVIRRAFASNAKFCSYLECPDVKEVGTNGLWEFAGSGSEVTRRLFLKPFVHPKFSEFQCGSKFSLPAGYVLYRLSEQMTPQELTLIKRQWKHCLDDQGCISPSVVHSWFSKGLNNAVKEYKKSTEEVNKEQKLSMGPAPYIWTVNSASHFTIGLSFPNPNPLDMDSEPTVVRVALRTSIHGSGWLPGLKLSWPLPQRPPYCTTGKDTLELIENLCRDGQSMWILDVPSQPYTKELPRFKDCLRMKEAMWQLNLTPAVAILKHYAWRCCTNYDIPGIELILELIVQYHGLTDLDTTVLQHVLMWTLKYHLMKCKDNGQVLVKCLQYLYQVLSSKFCPHFACPHVNMLQMTPEQAKLWPPKVKSIAKRIVDNPGRVLNYIGYGESAGPCENPRTIPRETTSIAFTRFEWMTELVVKVTVSENSADGAD